MIKINPSSIYYDYKSFILTPGSETNNVYTCISLTVIESMLFTLCFTDLNRHVFLDYKLLVPTPGTGMSGLSPTQCTQGDVSRKISHHASKWSRSWQPVVPDSLCRERAV